MAYAVIISSAVVEENTTGIIVCANAGVGEPKPSERKIKSKGISLSLGRFQIFSQFIPATSRNYSDAIKVGCSVFTVPNQVTKCKKQPYIVQRPPARAPISPPRDKTSPAVNEIPNTCCATRIIIPENIRIAPFTLLATSVGSCEL